MCFYTFNSAQHLTNLKQKLFHHIKDDNIYYVFKEGDFDAYYFPDNLIILKT